MSLRCTACNQACADYAKYCPRCGSTPVAEQPKPQRTAKPIPKNASDAWVTRFLGIILAVAAVACAVNLAYIWAGCLSVVALYMMTVPQPNPDLKMNKIKCPHCHEQGGVRTKRVRLKKGVSGAKATGAILTGGVSLLVTGLSRKEDMTEATCSNCGQVWHF